MSLRQRAFLAFPKAKKTIIFAKIEYSKHVLFCKFRKYGNYRVLIGSKYLRKIWFDSVFNRIFD